VPDEAREDGDVACAPGADGAMDAPPCRGAPPGPEVVAVAAAAAVDPPSPADPDPDPQWVAESPRVLVRA